VKVLVVTASKHGSTLEIADRIAAALRARAHEVDVEQLGPDPGPTTEGYDAVVIGSAVYAGRWLSAARDFVADNAASLATSHVWLFSSGPLDEVADEVALPADVDRLMTLSASLGHHVFAGRLDRSELSVPERLMVKLVHAPDGDFRDWDDMARWADQIADALAASNRVPCVDVAGLEPATSRV
jgi:menaquinone-dependent protoporphyrinogen oxidase